jgi:hypothetical protein
LIQILGINASKPADAELDDAKTLRVNRDRAGAGHEQTASGIAEIAFELRQTPNSGPLCFTAW